MLFTCMGYSVLMHVKLSEPPQFGVYLFSSPHTAFISRFSLGRPSMSISTHLCCVSLFYLSLLLLFHHRSALSFVTDSTFARRAPGAP